MRRAVRVGLVVLGAAMAVYGAASVTGWWLGTPPWAGDTVAETYDSSAYGDPSGTYGDGPGLMFDPNRRYEPEGYRTYAPLGPEFYAVTGTSRLNGLPRLPGWCAVGLGLALVAVGAWPRRRAGGVT